MAIAWLHAHTMKEQRQLLPKDLLDSARKFSGQEAEDRIMAAVRKYSIYSHSNNTSQFFNPMLGNSSSSWGTFSSSIISTAGNFTFYNTGTTI